jgi:putative membrane protein
MKKKLLSFAICLSAVAIWSCNNSGDTSSSGDSATGTTTDTMSNANTTNNTTVNTTPLSKDDSMFVMEAAMGGMMEVQAGQLAQQNAESQRVKDFGGMMVTDHSKANDELKGLASSHGMMLPDSLPTNIRKHLDEMKSMKGKSFDRHYMSMMANDHKKDISKFEKQANSGTDAQLKSWAGTTLPVLQKHMDSVTAIRKGM